MLKKSIIKRKNAVIGVWVVLIIFISYFAVNLPSVLYGNGFEIEGSHATTEEILEETFQHSPSTIIALFEKEKNVSSSEFQQSITSFLQHAEQLPSVTKVDYPSEEYGMVKNDLAYSIIHYDIPPIEFKGELQDLREITVDKQVFSVTFTGEPIVVNDMNAASQHDLMIAEAIGLPFALLVLLLAFGSFLAACIPLIIGIVTVIASMGIVYFFHHIADLSIFMLNIIPMIGLALSIDFALLLVNRFKEEVRARSVMDAVVRTLETAGRSVLFSGLCVFIGLSGMLFIDIGLFQNVALGGMIVVLISVSAALTLLPCLLYLIGEKINHYQFLKTREADSNTWRVLAQKVMKRPIIMMTFSLILLVIFALPLKQMALEIPGPDSLPHEYESRAAYETYMDTFVPENETMVTFVIHHHNGVNEESLQKSKQFIDSVNVDPLVTNVNSVYSALEIEHPKQLVAILSNPSYHSATSTFIQEDYLFFTATIAAAPTSTLAKNWVRTWEETRLEGNITVHLGGQAKFDQEIFDEIKEKAPYGLLLVFVSTFFILLLAYRSILIPIKAILMNILSLTASFGLLVWLFQGGKFGLPEADIALMIPVFVFGLVFGLSMDYEVFLISRIHEVYQQTGDNEFATVEGLTSTSKIITSAALIMIVVTGAFAFTGVTPVKQMGIGIALAIFIDATIVRMILVPSLMKLFGKANWWFFGF